MEFAFPREQSGVNRLTADDSYLEMMRVTVASYVSDQSRGES